MENAFRLHRKTFLLSWTFFALLVGIGIFWIWLFTRLPLDDAYIYVRYAENFAKGYGPVFNVAEHVEGYSGFSWFMLLAAGAFLGWPTDLFAQILSIASYFLILFALFFYGLRREQSSLKSLLYPALYIASTACALWAGLAIEMLFYSLCILLSLLAYLYLDQLRWQRIFTGLLGCLAGLSRPEGILVYAYILVFETLRQIVTRRKIDWNGLAEYSLGMLLFGFFIYSRYRYYGYVLPNTFYAKVGSGAVFLHRGLESLYEFLNTHTGGKIFFSAVMVHGLLFRNRDKEWWLMGPFTICFFAIVIKSGGDWWPFARYALPIYPVVVILFGNFFSRGLRFTGTHFFWRYLIKGAVSLALFLTVFTNANTVLMSSRTFPRSIFTPDYNRSFLMAGRFYGKLAEKIIGSNGIFALAPIPCVSHYYKGYVLDTLGLTDSHIAHRSLPLGHGTHAHEKGDGLYVLNMRPTLFRFFGHLDILSQPLDYPQPAGLSFVTDREILSNADFKKLYEPYSIRVHNQYAMFWKLRGMPVRTPPQEELDALYDELSSSHKISLQNAVLEKFYSQYNQIERFFLFGIYQKMRAILSGS